MSGKDREIEAAKDLPMAGTRIDECAVWLIPEFLGKSQRLFHTAGRIECAGMRSRREENRLKRDQTAQMVALNQSFEPCQVFSVVGRIFAVGIDQHIHVKKDHEVAP